MPSTEPMSDSIPAWKSEFLSKPSVSVRKAIADVYGAPYEDTSTLVLTAPSGKFVDIRFPKSVLRNEDGQSLPLISHPSFWAFSGTASTTFYDPHGEQPGFEYTAHTVFTHDIDSKGPGITDEGDCFILPNGDAMEIGVWSTNGQLYKELWSGPQLPAGETALVKKPVIVAETLPDNPSGRGIIIRLGNYIQGIFERKDVSEGKEQVVVRRLTNGYLRTASHSEEVSQEGQIEGNDAGSETWISDPRNNTTGEELLPCSKLIAGGWQVGMDFESGGTGWKVTECQS